MAELKSICPFCFKLFPLVKRIPVECGDCGSEGIDSRLEPLSSFLARTTLTDLEKKSAEWKNLTGLIPSYHLEKQKRIDHVLALKKNSTA